jgi:hypothetical protein
VVGGVSLLPVSILPKTRRGRLTMTISVVSVLVIAIVVVVVAAVSGRGTPSGPGYVSTYKTPDPMVIAPLRGTVVPASQVSGPAISVKICNVEHCEPQIGLNQADIVFEEIVEGGITRYVAIWQSEVPDVVGPVRSLRPMDADIAAPFGGIIAYSGYGAEETHQLALNTGLVNLTENNQNLMFRLDDRVAPYNLALKAKQAVKDNPGNPPAQQFAYSSGVESSSAGVDGAPASNINIVFSGSSDDEWNYDAASGKYLRWQWGGPDKDTDGKQLAATNVAIMRVDVQQFVGVPRTIMVSSGEAWVATGGKVVHGKWSKAGTADPIRFVTDAGSTVYLAPGNTWIEMVPTGGYAQAGSVAFK